MLSSPGLRLSLFGAILFVLGALALLVLPTEIAAVAMLIGATCVWSGFLVTMFHSYRKPPSQPPDEPSQ